MDEFQRSLGSSSSSLPVPYDFSDEVGNAIVGSGWTHFEALLSAAPISSDLVDISLYWSSSVVTNVYLVYLPIYQL